MFTSKCPLKGQISKGLDPFVKIELLKTDRIRIRCSQAQEESAQMLKSAAVKLRRSPCRCSNTRRSPLKYQEGVGYKTKNYMCYIYIYIYIYITNI